MWSGGRCDLCGREQWLLVRIDERTVCTAHSRGLAKLASVLPDVAKGQGALALQSRRAAFSYSLRPSTRRVTRTRIQTMGKKSRRNRPNGFKDGVRDMGTLTQEQVDRLRMPGIPSITPEKSEDFIKILERHPEHKTGDMSAV